MTIDARERWVLTIAKHISDAITVLDKNRTIRFANQAAAKMAGVGSASELLGQSYLEILKQHQIFNEDGSIALPSEFPSEIAFRQHKETRDKIYAQIDPRGVHYWLSITSFPLADSSGENSFVAVIYRDITEKKIHEDRLRFLIESSKILSITTDLDVRLSEKARLLVPTLADWVTINLLTPGGTLIRKAVVHRDSERIPLVERFAALAADHAQSREGGIYRVATSQKTEFYPFVGDMPSTSYNDEQRRLSAILRPCSAIITPIQTVDRMFGVLSLAYTAESGRHYSQEDVEFVEEYGHHLGFTIENTLLYEEIAKRDAAKDVFLATLSHELRNPLAPIKSSLELLNLKNKNAEIRPELSVIEHQFEQMEKLLRDLLDVTRLTLGKLQLEKAPIDLSALVRVCAETNRKAIEEDGLALSVAVPRESVWIDGDSVRIEQVLVNLIHNAAKFTPRGGTISVSLEEEAGRAVLSVADTGIGIGKADLEKVFERYFQSERRAPNKHSGLGMGLVLVQEIVRLHDGSVEARSEGEGEGSTFTIRLPLDKQRGSEKDEAKSAQFSKRKILVIDDNRDAADSLVKLLSAVGYSASAAYSGEEGTLQYAAINPSHVIVDLSMPIMDGYAVAQKLRSEARDVTLIALSGYGMEEDKKRAQDAGFDVHLTKPVGLYELQTVLEKK